MVQIVGSFGTLGIGVSGAGYPESMTEGQTIEAMRNGLSAMGEASDRPKDHLHALDPGGDPTRVPTAHIPLDARFA